MIYVDINNSYSATSGNGDEATPYNIVQFTDYVTSALATDDVFGLRGYYSNLGAGTVALNFYSTTASNVTVQSWDSNQYGFWKMEGDTIAITLGDGDVEMSTPSATYFKDFVFSNFAFNRSHNDGNLPVYFLNGIFRSTSDFEANNASSQDYLKGCTFAGNVVLNNDYFDEDEQGAFQFDDCVFYDAPLSDDVSKTIVFNYCTFSGTSAYNTSALTTSALTTTNCTFGWVPSATLPTISEITSGNKGNLSFESFGLDYNFTTRKSTWVTDKITSAAYKSNRRGPGAFNFTNKIFYVDLSATSTTGTGTILKPIEGIVFSANNGFYDNDDVRLRGSLIFDYLDTCQVNFGGSSGISMDAWNISAYGPWKMCFYGTTIPGNKGFTEANKLFLKNGILYCYDSTPILSGFSEFQVPVLILDNMFIVIYGGTPPIEYAPQFVTSADGQRLTMKGSTIFMQTMGTWALADATEGVSIAARDCVFDMSAFNGPTALSTSAFLDNCVFVSVDKAALKGTIFDEANIIDTNCQYGWDASEWPDIPTFSEKTDMSFHNLTQGTHEITISGSGQW